MSAEPLSRKSLTLIADYFRDRAAMHERAMKTLSSEEAKFHEGCWHSYSDAARTLESSYGLLPNSTNGGT